MSHSANRPPTTDVADDQKRKLSLPGAINIKKMESEETEKLMDLLREELTECGWKDEMKTLCRAYIKKLGKDNVTKDDLINVITPKGRASVPPTVKAELLRRIKTLLVSDEPVLRNVINEDQNP